MARDFGSEHSLGCILLTVEFDLFKILLPLKKLLLWLTENIRINVL